MEDKTHIKIKILGTSFSIQSSEKQEYLEQIMAYYKTRIDEVNEKVVNGEPLKLAIVAGLNIVDELFKERNRSSLVQPGSDTGTLELHQITERMIKKINNSLAEDGEE